MCYTTLNSCVETKEFSLLSKIIPGNLPTNFQLALSFPGGLLLPEYFAIYKFTCCYSILIIFTKFCEMLFVNARLSAFPKHFRLSDSPMMQFAKVYKRHILFLEKRKSSVGGSSVVL